uniref:Uncharacterized protein n=1 Tax=Rousettus aegyptiacus TaxID=9407 RepID=A0A7J8JJ81_ROUAE|nr:hypothetical protein HJG63_010380 [Rousettus aegyptiacus]
MGGKYKILVLDLVSETRSQRVVSPQCSGALATGQRAGDSLRVSGAGAPVGSEAGSSPRSGRDLVSGVAPPPLPVQIRGDDSDQAVAAPYPEVWFPSTDAISEQDVVGTGGVDQRPYLLGEQPEEPAS